jgi:putative ABC transport system permease protein
VEAISLSQRGPFDGATNMTRIHRPGDDSGTAISVASNGVTAGYFRALGIPIVAGRSFTDSEGLGSSDGACGPVIVSQSLAARFFNTIDAVGRVLILPKTAMNATLECDVVGVAGDIRWSGPANAPEPFLYRPLGRDAFGLSRGVVILARSGQPASQVAAALRKAAASVDPAVPLFFNRSLAQALEARMAEQQTISRVLALLALLGFLMAAVGLHGLVAETVVERTREFGIRMAVGASREVIFAAVIRHAARLAAIGMAAGLGLAAALSRALRSQLFGVTALEPSIYLGAAALLAGVVVFASLLPAIAATRVNPVEALRAE